ncbi:FMRFamide receptor-like [Lineus longissimus]|uniref:FMRFamide receptor-like n=1 Tax=Lineus longissimus TaxID=88925 RepID=UPI00315CC126
MEETNTTDSNTCLYDSMRATGSIFDAIRFYVSVHVMLSVACIGLIGNAFTLPVLSRELKSSSTSILLKSLAIADSIVLVAFTCRFSLTELYVSMGILEGYYEFFQIFIPYLTVASFFGKNFSMCLIVAMAIERYIAVCKPLHAKLLCTTRNAKIAIIVLAIFSFANNLRLIWHFDLTYVEDPCTGSAKPLHNLSDLLLNNRYYNIICNLVLYTTTNLLMPVTALYFTGFHLIRSMRRASKTFSNQADDKRQKTTNTVTIRVVAVIICFLILEAPNHILNCIYIVLNFSNIGFRIEFDIFFFIMSNLSILSVVNSSINFFIYLATGSNFRRLFWQLITFKK